jgi:hypothetical protein
LKRLYEALAPLLRRVEDNGEADTRGSGSPLRRSRSPQRF